MVSVHVGQPDIQDVDVPDQVVVFYPVEISVGPQAQAGRAAFVDVQGVQVGIAEVGVELIDGIAGFRGEGEDALEEEIEVRVAADDPAVERISGIGSGRRDACVVIAQGMEPVNGERIDPDGR